MPLMKNTASQMYVGKPYKYNYSVLHAGLHIAREVNPSGQSG